MAAGDFYIRRNASDTSAVPNAGGGNEDAAWDTLVETVGSICTYSDPNLQLDIGLYLIMYAEKFYTADTTTNERIEIQGEIHVSGTGAVGGYGSDYIRKASGQQECIVSGYMFLNVTADNTDVFIRFYRTDDSTTGTVNRVVGWGGVQILQMDSSTHNFGFYSTTSSEATSGTTERTLNINQNDRQDTGFSRTGDTVTVSNAGRYLVTYCLDISMTGTARENVRGYLRKNGTTRITGTQAHAYLRGSDSNQDSALTWIGIVDLAASDTLQVRWDVPTSVTMTAAAGATLQIWQIPSGGDECVIEATTGDYNVDAPFEWDTNPHIDTGSFTHTTGNSNVDVDQRDHVLVFASQGQLTDDTPQRAYPVARIVLDGVRLNYTAGGAYQRNSTTYGVGITVAGIVTHVATNGSIEIYDYPDGEAGTLTCDLGQFSLLSLESIWSYTYNPVISDMEDEQIDIGETDNVITGEDFEGSQGTGKVELVENSDYTGIKVIQTIDSWVAGSIQFDSVKGGLSDGPVYIFVTTNGGRLSNGYQVNLGVTPYSAIVELLSPDHYWKFQNTYDDEINGNSFNNVVTGSPVFVTTPKLCRGDTHSHQLDGTTTGQHIEATNSNYMNIGSPQTRRYMGGWIELDRVQQQLAVIYEEGAQINNIAFLIGFGNIILYQVADTDDDYVQTYSDFKLAPNRKYHIMFKFEASPYDGECVLYIDGVEQARSSGNPWTATDLDTHSGDISMGFNGDAAGLEVGGTDIQFATPTKCFYAHWATWSGVSLNPTTEIRQKLFEQGAREDELISNDTEANMQLEIDALADTELPDSPLAIKVQECTGGDFELVADNITFDDRASIQVQYLGTDTLTWVLENGSELDSNKVSTPNGGTVTIVNAPPVTVNVKNIAGSNVQDARVLLLAASGGDLPHQDSVTITRSASIATVTHTSHGLRTGNKVQILGANQPEYNGIHTITVTTVNAYTYTVSGTPATPATGTITCTSVILETLTNASGIATINHRYTSNQPFTGKARKTSSTPFYKTSNITGTITSTGYSGITFLILDE